MLSLSLAVFLALAVSAVCSLTETVLYSVTWAHIEKLRRKGRASGELLYAMRERVDKPITAVLTLNTIANTAGSAVAGAAFMGTFGPDHMAVFAATFTVLVLAFGEIIPKTLGISYANPMSAVIARPLALLTRILSPVIWLSGLLTRLVTPPASGPQISEDDIRAVASLSRQAGRIQPFEERTIRNILSLDRKRVRDIMTPRTVVFSLAADTTLAEAYKEPAIWHFSRIPVYGENNEDLVGVVERRALAQRMPAESAVALGDIMRPLHFVLESQTLDKLLAELLNARTHLFGVLDEYGGLAGVVSLEDVLEEILGSEIIDESDAVADLRELARQRRKNVVAQAERHAAREAPPAVKPDQPRPL